MSSSKYIDLYNKYFMPVYKPVDFIPVRGHGSRLYNEANEDMIDFAGGVAASALGQTNRQLVHALTNQAQTLWHVGNTFTNLPQLELAQRLIDNTCFDKLFLCNSGTEAVEASLKLARRYCAQKYGKQKNKIVAFNKAFHGRTMLAVSVGGQPKYWDGYDPLPQAIVHGDFNNVNALNSLINDEVAAVIVEPIQAEGGVIPATTQFLHKLRELCHKHKAILIFDEVQTGMGRTGSLFAYMTYQIEPDMITIAKALAGGFPIGAMLTKLPYNEGFEFGSHGATFGGNPLSCKVACKAFDILSSKEVLNGVGERSKIFIEELTLMNKQLNIYSEIRGKGLLLGAELQPRFQGKAYDLVKLAAKHKVAILNASPNVLRFLPSLIIPFEDIRLGIKRLYNALDEFLSLNQ